MEQEIDDGMFWLPAEFLNDDEVTGKLNSGKSSPMESVMGSTETESDEEDYLNELTRKLAQSTLEDVFWKSETNFSFENHFPKSTRGMVGSPQSTLCGCKEISSRGSPNSPSPAAAASRNDSELELLSAAAGEVARLRMAEEAGFKYYNSNGNHTAPQPPRRIPSPNFHLHQIQAAQKQQQLMKQHQLKQQHYQQFVQQSKGRSCGGGNVKTVVLPPLSAWPTLQQSQQLPRGSGMRAVFLGNPNAKRESTGTGVFLPRQIGAPTEIRKKQGCSTVLLPDRVVHALNLNVEAETRSNGGHTPFGYGKTRNTVLMDEAEMRYRNSVLMAEQRRKQVEMDLRLPQEWTY